MKAKRIHSNGVRDGTGWQKCRFCTARSVAGLVKWQVLCRYHWARAQWGAAWADKCEHDDDAGDELIDYHAPGAPGADGRGNTKRGKR